MLCFYSRTTDDITSESTTTLDTITETFISWWWYAKLTPSLVLLWLFLAIIGYSARSMYKLKQGWKMLKGDTVDGAWMLL